MSRNVELLPDEYLARPVYRKRVGQWAVLALALSGLVCVFAYFQRKDIDRLKQEIVPLRQSVDELRKMGDRFAHLTGEFENATARQSVIDRLRKGTPEWSRVMEELSDATNGELWFLEVTLHEMDEDKEDGGVRGSQIRIQGVAPSNVEITQFMRRLSASKHFRELQLESSREPQSQDRNEKVEFGIGGIAL